MKTLYTHQQKLLDSGKKRWGIFHEGGAGKTITALELAQKYNVSALIVCPKLIKLTWERECKNYPKQTHKIVSKEEFRRDWRTYGYYPMLIWDESHFVSHKSQMTKAVLAYNKLHNPPYRYLLTGTPFADPFSLYYQAQVLGHNWNYWMFRQKFYYDVRMGMRTVPVLRSNMEAELKAMLLTIGETLALADVFDVPEQIYKTEYLALTPDQEKKIKEIRTTETEHIVKWTKIYQVMGGTLKGNEYEDDQYFKSEKVERLMELVNDNDKLIVVCRFNNEIAMLKERLKDCGKPVFVINGEVPVAEKRKIIDDLALLDHYCVLVNAACSEGWEAPTCPLMVFYSVCFDLKNFKQMQWRIHRANHLKHNYYISLVVANSIDEDVHTTLQAKEDFHLSLYTK